jgi:hypothetical protein
MYSVYESQISAGEDITISANIANLTDFEVANLRVIFSSMRELLEDFAAVHDYADAIDHAPEPPKAEFDTTTWYAAWTAGWNAQREGKSMAECAPAFERFKGGLDRDPFLDEDPLGGRVSTEMALEDEENTMILEDNFVSHPAVRVEDIKSINVNGLIIDLDKVDVLKTDCHGDLPEKGISPTDFYKVKNENELLKRRLAKLEGAIQQLWEDTEHVS